MASSTATTKLACGHFTNTTKSSQSGDSKTKCSQTCNAVLACGHNCRRKCFECRKYDKTKGIVTDHGTCEWICGQPLKLCPHQCMTRCHFGEPCPTCTKPCEIRCQHRQCPLPCGKTCLPCSKQTCAVGCVHSRCSLPCAFPCDVELCSRRCDKTLACGCQCPSSCPEPCPDAKYCQNCSSEAVKDTIVDLFEWKAYNDVDLSQDPCIFPPCGHMITLSSLDGHMDMKTLYLLDEKGVPCALRDHGTISKTDEFKSCPACRASLSTVTRYAHLLRRRDISQISNHHIDVYAQLAPRYQERYERILPIFSLSEIDALPGAMYPDFTVSLDQMIMKIQRRQTPCYTDLLSICNAAKAAIRDLTVDLQPYAFFRQILADHELDASKMTVSGSEIAIHSMHLNPVCNRYRSLYLEISAIVLTNVVNPAGYTNLQGQKHRPAKDLVCFNDIRQQLADLHADASHSNDQQIADEALYHWGGMCMTEAIFSSEVMPEAPDAHARACTTQRIIWLTSLAALCYRECAWRYILRTNMYPRTEQITMQQLEIYCHQRSPSSARLLHQIEHPYVLRYYHCSNKHYQRIWNAFPLLQPHCPVCQGPMHEERDWTRILQHISDYLCW